MQIIQLLELSLTDLARTSDELLLNGLNNPNFLTVTIVFAIGLLTSLGPCSLSLMPVTLAYLAGFSDSKMPFQRSLSFCLGIVLSLVVLGSISGLIGQIYGQVPDVIPTFVAILAIIMGLNLLGILKIPMPSGPDPSNWSRHVPPQLAPLSAGLAFGLASSPCSTPVLAVLLGWIAQNGTPLTGMVLLSFFGLGQVMPLLLAGTIAASVSTFQAIRPFTIWIPPLSGGVLLTTGSLSLLSRWI